MSKQDNHMLRIKDGTFQRFHKVLEDYAGPLGNKPTHDRLMNELMDIYEEQKTR